MPQYVALLGAINVGGHIVKMADLRTLFEQMGFTNVSTFIASGNVIFDANNTDIPALEAQIEVHLKQALGYAVPTFLRTPAELAAVVTDCPFPPADIEADNASLYITFRKEAVKSYAEQRLTALNSDTDRLAVSGRELYWLCLTRSSDSPLSSGVLVKKALGTSASAGTTRNVTTVRKLASKYARAGSG